MKFYSTIPDFVDKPNNPLFQDLEGFVFERVVVIGHAGRINKIRYWFVKCDCGNIFKASASHLKRGNINSCGCLRHELSIKHGHAVNRVLTKTYKAWRCIKTRCYNQKSKDYKDYGGMGIKMCDEWRRDFNNFLSDMGECPDGLSIDRIENNKGYYKENCRWATLNQQANNKRNNVFLTFDGKTKTVAQWANELNVNPKKLWNRIYRGWSIERTLSI